MRHAVRNRLHTILYTVFTADATRTGSGRYRPRVPARPQRRPQCLGVPVLLGRVDVRRGVREVEGSPCRAAGKTCRCRCGTSNPATSRPTRGGAHTARIAAPTACATVVRWAISGPARRSTGRPRAGTRRGCGPAPTGFTERNATACSSDQTNRAGSSPAMMREKTVVMVGEPTVGTDGRRVATGRDVGFPTLSVGPGSVCRAGHGGAPRPCPSPSRPSPAPPPPPPPPRRLPPQQRPPTTIQRRRAGESRRARTPCGRGREVPTHWARATTAPGRTSRSSPRSPSAWSCACSPSDGTETRVAAARGRRVRLARLPAHRRARPALRLPDPRPVRPRQGPAVQPEQAADRPLREGRRRPGAVGRGGVRLPVRLAGRAQRDGLRAVRAEVGGRQPVLRLGQRPPPAHPLPRDGDLRGARQGPHRSSTPTSPRRCAAPTRASRTR